MSYLYVIAHPEGWRKIGRAQNPAIRIRQHQGHCREQLKGEAMFQCADARAAERVALDRLSEFRIMGEWFKVDRKTAFAVVSAVTESKAEPFPLPLVKKALHGKVGRPPLNVKPTLVRLSNGVAERIDVLVGTKKRAEFIREAVEKELKRRERQSRMLEPVDDLADAIGKHGDPDEDAEAGDRQPFSNPSEANY